MADETDSSVPDFWNIRFSRGQTPWDAGRAPRDLESYLERHDHGGRVLIPGCGSAYEAAAFHNAGHDVLAIDFSEAAIAAARRQLGALQSIVRPGDFFADDFEGTRFDVIYERAFLCSLPRRMWSRYADRVGELVKPGGVLVGLFYFDPGESGPPFGLREGEIQELLKDRFTIEVDRRAVPSAPIFMGRERWLEWRRAEA